QPHRADPLAGGRIEAGGYVGRLRGRVVPLRDAPDRLGEGRMARHVVHALAVQEHGAPVAKAREIVGAPAHGGTLAYPSAGAQARRRPAEAPGRLDAARPPVQAPGHGRTQGSLDMSEREGELDGVLSGVRVLDFGRYIAGPYCAALLADLGAGVIRIGRIGGGEDRWVAPVGEDGV